MLAPHYDRLKTNPRIRAFVDGITAAATGAIAGAAFVLGRRALMDVTTVIIAMVALLVLTRTRRIPEPLLILAAAISGIVAQGLKTG